MGAKVGHAFRMLKQQFSFERSRLGGIGKNQRKVLLLAALSNLFMVRKQMLWMEVAWEQYVQIVKPSHQ